MVVRYLGNEGSSSVMLVLVLYGKRSLMQKYCRHNARNAVFPLPPLLLLFSLIFAISKNRNTFFAPLTKNFTGKEKLERKGVSAIFMTSLSLSENSRELFSSSVKIDASLQQAQAGLGNQGCGGPN